MEPAAAVNTGGPTELGEAAVGLRVAQLDREQVRELAYSPGTGCDPALEAEKPFAIGLDLFAIIAQ